MVENFSGEYDLFGRAIPERKAKRGRPQHVWTIENSNKINLLFATDHEPAECAAALGISMPTFRKHYFFELEGYNAAQLRLKAKLLSDLHKQADEGNVAAAKELFRQVDLGRISKLAGTVAHRQPAESKPKPGKKEKAVELAGEVAGKYGVPDAPLLN